MSKKVRDSIIGICAMVVLSIGVIVGIKFTNGDFGAKEKTEALDVTTFASESATITEAAKLLDSEDAVCGYTVTVTAVGFNAAEPIEMKVKFDAEKANVTGFEVLAQKETDGLGANITTEEFAAQFSNMAAPVYTADMNAEGTAFDQVTGASMSSKAVAAGINAAYEFLSSIQ